MQDRQEELERTVKVMDQIQTKDILIKGDTGALAKTFSSFLLAKPTLSIFHLANGKGTNLNLNFYQCTAHVTRDFNNHVEISHSTYQFPTFTAGGSIFKVTLMAFLHLPFSARRKRQTEDGRQT